MYSVYCAYNYSLNTVFRELGDSDTIAKGYFDLASLHLHCHRPSLALKCLQQTLDLAKQQGNKALEGDTLREMAQVMSKSSAWDDDP